MPFQQSRVDDVPGFVSSAVVDLRTGEVRDLTVYARYSITALVSLMETTPSFPRQPLAFHGPYGSAWARFEQRPDGRLDFVFAGTAFVPPGPGHRVAPALRGSVGPETGWCVPVACWLLGPGGVLAEPGVSPVSLEFPGRLSPGALGYYEMLRFPLRTCALDDLAVISDSFEISIGLAGAAVRSSGACVG